MPALRALLVGKKITDLSYDATEGMIILEVGGRYGALQWIDMKSDAQGVIA